jgi:hypothetical protein
MPRIRTIKPEHWGDHELPNISLQAHLLWIGMWNFSDDKGVIENDPVKIKSDVFPRRTDIRQKQILLWLDQLVKARFIVPLQYANKSYYIHRTFDIHQRIDKPQSSRIPDEVIDHTLAPFNSKNVPGTIPAVLYSSVQESNGEGNGPPTEFSKKNKEKKNLGKKEGPAPPKYSEILEFFDGRMGKQWSEQKIANEAGKFFSHYGAMGWKIRNQAIEDWEMKAIEWMIREQEGSLKTR